MKNDDKAVANGGWLRPPLVFGMLLLLAIVLNYFVPLNFESGVIAKSIAVVMAVCAVALLVWSARIFKAAGTPVTGNRRTREIVSDGPYRFSRNPIYVAFVLLAAAAFVATGNFWMSVAVVAATAIINQIVIPREEEFLSGVFGEPYRDYMRRVPRWF